MLHIPIGYNRAMIQNVNVFTAHIRGSIEHM